MTKPKKCSFNGCDAPRMKKPGNNTFYFQYCIEHQINATVTKIRAEKKKQKESMEQLSKAKKRTPRQSFYASKAWKYFSRYVLLFYSDENLMVNCSTNPLLEYKITDKRICVGHYIKVFDANSTNYSTAFHFKNVAPQSVQDNIYKGGNMEEMAKWLDLTHGEGTAKEMEQLSRTPLKLDKYELDKIAQKYKQKFKDELNKRNITNPWN